MPCLRELRSTPIAAAWRCTHKATRHIARAIKSRKIERRTPESSFSRNFPHRNLRQLCRIQLPKAQPTVCPSSEIFENGHRLVSAFHTHPITARKHFVDDGFSIFSR